MPNHCSNYLLVATTDEYLVQLKAFHKLVSSPVLKTHYDMETKQETKTWVQGYFLCDNIFPCPTELTVTPAVWYGDADKQEAQRKIEEANVAKYGHKDWYDWCSYNWGTKWGDYDTVYMEHLETTNLRAYRYTTAWSPMTEAIHKFAQMFPNLLFVNAYEEGGMGFLGATAFYRESMWEDEGDYPEVDWDADDTGFEKVEQNMSVCARSVIDMALDDSYSWLSAKTFAPFFKVLT
jgi:hypothetical protein